jgi:hypothetical protein
MNRTQWSDEETELLLSLVQKRERLDFVASEFGRSIEDLRRRLRELGIESVCRRVVVRLPATNAGA